jgi:quercetin dioxygenase-like cupin family protein
MGEGDREELMRQEALAVLLIMACAPGASSAPPTAAAVPNSASVPIIRTAHTVSGQPLRLPRGNAEMVATAVEIPANGATAIHQHPWSRFVYVERGPLRVINHDTGETRDFQTGEVFAEVIAQWHEGRAPGVNGARLVVIDLVPPGTTNMKMR